MAAELTELGGAFRRVFRNLSRLRGRDTHLGGSELSYAQFELLIELHDRGPLPAGELAVAARLAPGTVTQMLDHLAEGGMVERVRSEVDRRVVVSRLTAQGRGKIQAKREAWKNRWELALDGVETRRIACCHPSARTSRHGVRGCAPGGGLCALLLQDRVSARVLRTPRD